MSSSSLLLSFLHQGNLTAARERSLSTIFNRLACYCYDDGLYYGLHTATAAVMVLLRKSIFPLIIFSCVPPKIVLRR